MNKAAVIGTGLLLAVSLGAAPALAKAASLINQAQDLLASVGP